MHTLAVRTPATSMAANKSLQTENKIAETGCIKSAYTSILIKQCHLGIDTKPQQNNDLIYFDLLSIISMR